MPPGIKISNDVWEPVAELPSPTSGPRSPAEQIAHRLRTEKPGEWVKVRTGNHSHSTYVQALRRHGAEAVVRTVDGEKCVFARVDASKPVETPRRGRAAATDRAAADVLALQTRTRPAVAVVQRPEPVAETLTRTRPVPASLAPKPMDVTPAAVAEDLSASTTRMADLRKALREWPEARRHGFRTTDLLDRIPADVLDGAARPATLVDLAMDAQLHARVIAWLAGESAA